MTDKFFMKMTARLAIAACVLLMCLHPEAARADEPFQEIYNHELEYSILVPRKDGINTNVSVNGNNTSIIFLDPEKKVNGDIRMNLRVSVLYDDMSPEIQKLVPKAEFTLGHHYFDEGPYAFNTHAFIVEFIKAEASKMPGSFKVFKSIVRTSINGSDFWVGTFRYRNTSASGDAESGEGRVYVTVYRGNLLTVRITSMLYSLGENPDVEKVITSLTMGRKVHSYTRALVMIAVVNAVFIAFMIWIITRPREYTNHQVRVMEERAYRTAVRKGLADPATLYLGSPGSRTGGAARQVVRFTLTAGNMRVLEAFHDRKRAAGGVFADTESTSVAIGPAAGEAGAYELGSEALTQLAPSPDTDGVLEPEALESAALTADLPSVRAESAPETVGSPVDEGTEAAGSEGGGHTEERLQPASGPMSGTPGSGEVHGEHPAGEERTVDRDGPDRQTAAHEPDPRLFDWNLDSNEGQGVPPSRPDPGAAPARSEFDLTSASGSVSPSSSEKTYMPESMIPFQTTEEPEKGTAWPECGRQEPEAASPCENGEPEQEQPGPSGTPAPPLEAVADEHAQADCRELQMESLDMILGRLNLPAEAARSQEAPEAATGLRPKPSLMEELDRILRG